MISCIFISFFLSKLYALELTPLETTLPWVVGERSYGEVRVIITGEEIQRFKSDSLYRALKSSMRPSIYRDIDFTQEWIDALDLPIIVNFNPEQLELNPLFKEDYLLPQVYSLALSPHQRYADRAIKPAPIGGAINYQVEKHFGDGPNQREKTSLFIDSFFNIQSTVIESKIYYRETQNNEKQWFRGDTRIVKDFEDHRIRVQVGDVYPSGFGLMQASPIGGAAISRQFLLSPYHVPYSQGEGEFTLNTRSEVRTFLNDSLIRSETLPAGTYNIRDLPLVNGLNNVRVEVTDEFGNKRFFEFNLPISTTLLRKNEWNFSLSSGTPFQDQDFKRQYDSQNLTSGFAQYGVTNSFTTGAYAQRIQDYTLFGVESGLSTLVGNFFLGIAQSDNEDNSGLAANGVWRYQKIGGQLFSSYNFALRHEAYEKSFQRNHTQTNQALRSRTQANLSVPLLKNLTTSIGANLLHYREGSHQKAKGWNLNLNWRMMPQMNLNFFISQNRDQLNNKNNIAYAFFTWSFGGSRNLITGFRDIENNSNRITATRDNHNRLYSPRITASIEESDNLDRAEVDGIIQTPYAEFGARVGGRRQTQTTERESNAFGSIRLSSAFVFARDQESTAFGISKPVRNSFALFKPSEELKRQNITLTTTSVYPESASGVFDTLTATNLIPYQYREIQLDPSRLDPGISLEQEKFVLFPTYKSAHLINLRDRGSVVVRGRIVDEYGESYSLKVGSIGDDLFFTDRQGNFYLEGLSPGEHPFKIEGSEQENQIIVEKNSRGFKDVGVIIFNLKEDF